MQNKICGIYKITSPTNKIYIGQSVDVHNRFRNYKNCHAKDQQKLYNSLKKHTPERHLFEIIEVCEYDILTLREQHYIDFYKSIDTGLNIRNAGSKGRQSEETKAKIKKALTGVKHTEERRRNISKAQIGKRTGKDNNFYGISRKGKDHPMFGKSPSKEVIEKYRKAKLGKKQSPETIRKRFESRKGYVHSETTKAKISQANRKNNLLSLFEKRNLSLQND